MDFLSCQGRIYPPVTGNIIPISIRVMSKPGRRSSSSSEWKLAFIQRVINAREASGLDQSRMAAELQRRTGRTVSRDTYRKYEILDAKRGAMLRHDLIVAFCEITRVAPAALLEGAPFQTRPKKTEAQERAASRIPAY